MPGQLRLECAADAGGDRRLICGFIDRMSAGGFRAESNCRDLTKHGVQVAPRTYRRAGNEAPHTAGVTIGSIRKAQANGDPVGTTWIIENIHHAVAAKLLRHSAITPYLTYGAIIGAAVG